MTMIGLAGECYWAKESARRWIHVLAARMVRTREMQSEYPGHQHSHTIVALRVSDGTR
jgi:hypothetical protein